MKLATLLLASLILLSPANAVAEPNKAYGIGFSPYMNGQDPNQGTIIGTDQIASRLTPLAPYFTWVRTFGSTNGLEHTPAIARRLGLKVAAGAWISSDATQNALEISNLIAAANAGAIDIAIVGSEAILRNDVTETQLIAYMNQVRQAIPSSVPVTTADVYGTFLAHPSLISASDVIFANFYPYWEGTSIQNALCALDGQYRQLVNASGTKQVIVSETGWPTAGKTVGAAVPSATNAALYAQQFFSWSKAHAVASFYFEAYDEQWKSAYEGPQGAHWGIWDASGVLKPGMDAFFNGNAVTIDCNKPVGDFDGDGKAEIAVYRPSTGTWWILDSSTNYTTYRSQPWGISTDTPVSGDFDGDGKADIAVYRPSTGTWWILYSSTNYTTYRAVSWGISTDTPVAGDFDGDGKTDIAVYRPSTGTWWILYSSTNYTTYRAVSWGISTDTPVAGDFDGDGKTDIAVYRPSTGTWWILYSSTNYTTYRAQSWGISTDIPVPGDYDGDGKTDLAIFRPSTATWWVMQSSTNYTTWLAQQWGASGDIPIPGDYDGDGKVDLGLYRPSTGMWYVLLSTSNYTAWLAQHWGVSTDIPVLKAP